MIIYISTVYTDSFGGKFKLPSNRIDNNFGYGLKIIQILNFVFGAALLF